MTTHVVQYSGGIGSWAAAQRVVREHGPAGVCLLFADTRVEHPDLYRFLRETAARMRLPLYEVADGRTPFEVFADVHFLGNSRLAPCSHHLKQKPCRAWLDNNTSPNDTVLYVGIDWSEERRTPAIVKGWQPWPVKFPMTAEPKLTKADMLAWCRAEGIRPPRLYELGFSHNNCSAACVRAGQKQWRLLLEKDRDWFLYNEYLEEELRRKWDKDVAILKETRNGVTRPLPLAELRRRHDAQLMVAA